MLINGEKQGTHVEFVSYSGRYPCLCTGELVLKIDGVEYRFSTDVVVGVKDDVYAYFWHSGGGLDADYCPYQGEWRIDAKQLPKELRKYAIEIDYVFNENVPHGCCGGCS